MGGKGCGRPQAPHPAGRWPQAQLCHRVPPGSFLHTGQLSPGPRGAGGPQRCWQGGHLDCLKVPAAESPGGFRRVGASCPEPGVGAGPPRAGPLPPMLLSAATSPLPWQSVLVAQVARVGRNPQAFVLLGSPVPWLLC